MSDELDSALEVSENLLADMMNQLTDAVDSSPSHDSWIAEHIRFKQDRITAMFTVHDNDFGQVMLMFVSSFNEEFSDLKLRMHSKAKLKAYFTYQWEMSCRSLMLLNQIRGYHIVKDGPDLYCPRGHSNPDKTEQYLKDSFRCEFGSDAQDCFTNEVDTDFGGNGEFVFIDADGNMRSF